MVLKWTDAGPELRIDLQLPPASNTVFEINCFGDCYTCSLPSYSWQPQVLLLLLPFPHPSHCIVSCLFLKDCTQRGPKHCLVQAKTAY